MAELAREEMEALQAAIEQQGERLKYLLLPKDPLDEKNIMLEVRRAVHAALCTLHRAVKLDAVLCCIAALRRGGCSRPQLPPLAPSPGAWPWPHRRCGLVRVARRRRCGRRT